MINRTRLQVGDQIVHSYWAGFGRPIPCTVVKIGAVKIKVRFLDADDQPHDEWVPAHNLFHTAREVAGIYEVLR
jgi:hypothetical protein